MDAEIYLTFQEVNLPISRKSNLGFVKSKFIIVDKGFLKFIIINFVISKLVKSKMVKPN